MTKPNIPRTSGAAHAVDGTRIAYSLFAAAPGAPRIALLHSLAMDRDFWLPVVAALAGEASVLVVDSRGHGESGKAEGRYTAELFAADLGSVFDAIRWSSAIVAGASMGGCVALQFAADFPARTDALGLIDTTAWYGATAVKDWETRAARALTDGLPALVEFQTTRWFSDAFRSADSGVVQASVATFLRNDPRAFAESCRMLGSFDARAALGAIRVPTAVVVGEEDFAAPVAMAQALQDGIAQASLTIIPGARHLTPLETPEVIAEQLRRLIKLCKTASAH